MLISDSMGFRTFFCSLCFHSLMFVHCFPTDPANSLTVSMIKWDASLKEFSHSEQFIVWYIPVDYVLSANLEYENCAKKSNQPKRLFIFYTFEMNSFALNAHREESFHQQLLLIFFVEKKLRGWHSNIAKRKHNYTHIQVHASCISKAFSFPLYFETFNLTEMSMIWNGCETILWCVRCWMLPFF